MLINKTITLKELSINQHNLKTCDLCNINKHNNKKQLLIYCTNESDPILNGNYHIALCDDCLKEYGTI